MAGRSGVQTGEPRPTRPGVFLDGLGLSQGTGQSLKAKLQAASRALDRGDETTAASVLEAFINEVEAQRGKKISEADADALISAARLIIEAL